MSEHLQLQFLHEIDKLTSKKYAETINHLLAGNKLFATCQTKGEVNPTHHPCVNPWQTI